MIRMWTGMTKVVRSGGWRVRTAYGRSTATVELLGGER